MHSAIDFSQSMESVRNTNECCALLILVLIRIRNQITVFMSTSSEMQIRRMAASTSVSSTHSSASLSSSDEAMTSTSKIIKHSVEPVLYSEFAVRLNENSLEQCRTSVSALAGCVAGIMGLTSYKGFVFYGFSMFTLSLIIFLFIRHEHRKFFTGLNHVFTNGFFNGLLTYVLFWTFLYGIVHLY
jgi:ER membrane protein complex subunit 6